MISNRILQTTVDGLKAISRVDLCIVDADKNVAAKTFDTVSYTHLTLPTILRV